MEFDAFDAGIEPGGLRSQREIRLVVCYLLANIEQPVKRTHIVEAMTQGSLANYFEISSAVADMLVYHNITEDSDGFLHLNEERRSAIDELETELPLTVRERAVALCTRLVLKERYRKENRVEIVPYKNGFYVNCSVMADEADDILSFRLYAGSITQAEMIKERFYNNPVLLYDRVIDALFE